jgi:hypothetical protein
VNTIPLDEAAALLHDMAPDEAPNWRRQIFDPDYILDRARALGADAENVRVRDWENISDGELVDMLLAGDASLMHDAVVITDVCLGMRPPGAPHISGAFAVQGGQVREFIDDYRSQVTPHFIDGDVIVAFPSDCEIRVFHHEGLVAKLRFRELKGREPTT